MVKTFNNRKKEGVKMKASTVGIDLAKNVFQLHVSDRRGKKIFNKKVPRKELVSVIDKLDKEEDFLVAMEACGGSHHIARILGSKGYKTGIIAAKFIKPYVKSNKNDARDAEAIAEAARRPHMRFVGMKSIEQQDIQLIHRVREGFIKRKTALANEIRGCLLEYGITVPKGVNLLKKLVPVILSNTENGLTTSFRELLRELYDDLSRCFEKVEYYDKKLQVIHNNNEDCKRLSGIDGVGLVSSTALVAAVGDPSVFKNGREFSAWMGLTPRQFSTGGKTTLLGISKRGDKYIRKNLIHGCRSVVNHAKKKNDKRSKWINEKLSAKGLNKTAVAVANRTARVVWAVLVKKEEYKSAI